MLYSNKDGLFHQFKSIIILQYQNTIKMFCNIIIIILEQEITMTTQGNNFIINGKETKIYSAAIHYFRVPRERWADSINKARLLGLNTIETYIAWNVHETVRGEYNFSGMYDICAFLDEIKKAGMHAIVRPSPYICAEWDFGGMPYWILEDENIRLRCMDKLFIKELSRWYEKLIPMLVPHTTKNGGAIIAVQVENEYGSYGNDSEYIRWNLDKMRELNLDTFYFTSDGPEDFMLQGGTLPDMFKVVNFGSGAEQANECLQKYQPDEPFMCGEFWNGWFNAWGSPDRFHDRNDKDCVDELEKILKIGGSFNLYMFHGGTNFGFMAGANYADTYTPDTTSYDYGAPLDECGDITPKYLLMRECMKKYTNVPNEELPKPSKKKNYGSHHCTGSVLLFNSLDNIGKKINAPCPYNMERLGQGYGYILYRTKVTGPRSEMPIVLQEVRDRAQVFVDGKLVGIVDRNENQKIPLSVPNEGVKLDVLVENLARINYGPQLKDIKGISEGIRHGQQFLFGYEICCLPMDNLENLQFSKPQLYSEPAFYNFEVEVDECCDTYLDMSEWGKGFVTLNGFNLGRYWDIGPQTKLFVPASFLKKGKNEIIVFEETKSCEYLKFTV